MNAKSKSQSIVSPASYKQKLLDARALRRQTGGLLFDRVRLLCEVFDDRDFRADLGNVDDLAVAQALDREVDDTGFDFLQLREIFQANPDRQTWETGKLADLYQAVLEAHRKAQADDKPIRTRHVIRREDYEQVETELKDTRNALQQAEVEAEIAKRQASEVEALRAELREAKRRIADLERENARLRRELEVTRRQDLVKTEV